MENEERCISDQQLSYLTYNLTVTKTIKMSTDKPFITTRKGILFTGDCLETISKIRSQTIDTVFADPPFNLDKNYRNGYADNLAPQAYFDWCQQWIQECCRIIKPGGAFFIYATPELAVRFANFLLANGMSFRHWIALTMKGTYRRGKKLYPAHYALLYFTKGEPKTFNNLRVPIPVCRHCGKEIKDYGGHRDALNPEGLNLTDFWEDTSPNRHHKYKVRPGVNELKLMIPERAILMSTDPGDIVFDPFGGGGSTYQAAEKNDRNWIGTELYDCDHIVERLTEQFPESIMQKPQFDIHQIFTMEAGNEDNGDAMV
jgi:site-specific DNA-methyltransferase (adenine-specific)